MDASEPPVTRARHETYLNGRHGTMFCRQCGCDTRLMSQEAYDATLCVWPNNYRETLMAKPDAAPSETPVSVAGPELQNPLSRWETINTPVTETMQFRCKICGRISPTPDKACNLFSGYRPCREEWQKQITAEYAALLATARNYDRLLAAVAAVCESRGVNAEDAALAELATVYEALTGKPGKAAPPLHDPIAHALLQNPD